MINDKRVRQIIKKEGEPVGDKRHFYICLLFKSKYIIYRRDYEEQPWQRLITIEGHDLEDKSKWTYHKIESDD